jgi:hypothetical protein
MTSTSTITIEEGRRPYADTPYADTPYADTFPLSPNAEPRTPNAER